MPSGVVCYSIMTSKRQEKGAQKFYTVQDSCKDLKNAEFFT